LRAQLRSDEKTGREADLQAALMRNSEQAAPELLAPVLTNSIFSFYDKPAAGGNEGRSIYRAVARIP